MPPNESPASPEIASAVEALLERCPFGPGFFATQLRAFIRDCCPDPREGLPSLEVHLGSGESLEVCHVVGLTPAWVAVAVRDGPGGDGGMRTELIPYRLICRVTVRPGRSSQARVGFDATREPLRMAEAMVTPEEALRLAARETSPT